MDCSRSCCPKTGSTGFVRCCTPKNGETCLIFIMRGLFLDCFGGLAQWYSKLTDFPQFHTLLTSIFERVKEIYQTHRISSHG
jgi:hypothetical protein